MKYHPTHFRYAALLAAGGMLALEASAAPAVMETGPHHTLWQDVRVGVDELGQPVLTTNSWTELSTGLNHWNPLEEQWEPSIESFEITPTGYAVAARGQHRLILAPDINEGGSVDLELPGGQRLRSNPMGLSFFDRSTGKSVLLAEVTNCAGELVAPNVVLYRNCFDTLKASIRCVYARYGMEQLVILHENPGSPARYGLNPETTTLEMFTEFHQPPTPRKILRQLATDEVDEELDFGNMRVGAGVAYAEAEPGQVPLIGMFEGGLRVTKLWQQIEGRDFLIESVPLTTAQPALERLPTAPVETMQAALKRQTSDRRDLLASLPRKASGVSEGRQIAKASAPKPVGAFESPGFVLDYPITLSTSSQTNYVFKGDTTYYISGRLDLYGTTMIEGGTVVKYANTNNPCFIIWGPVNCATLPYRMAVFSAKDDDSVGETITGSTGSPSGTYADYAIYINWTYTFTDLHDLRICYAWLGTMFNYTAGSVRNAQFVDCAYPIYASHTTLTVRNALVHGVTGYAIGAEGSTVSAEHVTIHNAHLAFANSAGGTLGLTNSLLSSVTNFWYSFTSSSNATNSGGSMFSSAIAGAHYLADNTYRNAGTTNISPSLLADLKRLTTYPPLVLTNDFTTDTVLVPQAQRDTDAPDLGYHYNPLDYCWSGLNLTNATLTLTNGVAVAVYGTKGVILQDGAQVISEGSPVNLNRYVRYTTVQEQPVIVGTNSSTRALFDLPGPYTTPPVVRMRFTDIAQVADETQRRRVFYAVGVPGSLSLTDCQLGAGFVAAYPTTNTVTITVAFTNTVVERTWLSFTEGTGGVGYPLHLSLYNNLIRFGHLGLAYVNTNGTWAIHDNLFDYVEEGVTQDDPINFPIPASHNAAWGANSIGTFKIYLTSCNYQAGPLGSYYYPTNGGTNSLTSLIDAGSRNATNAGLYHFTVTTNQVKEATTQVDVGCHYVAVDATTGLPLDYDGDGIPDYLEDRNGNGTPDSGETDWQSASDLGLGVWITEPKNNANLP